MNMNLIDCGIVVPGMTEAKLLCLYLLNPVFSGVSLVLDRDLCQKAHECSKDYFGMRNLQTFCVQTLHNEHVMPDLLANQQKAQ